MTANPNLPNLLAVQVSRFDTSGRPSKEQVTYENALQNYLKKSSPNTAAAQSLTAQTASVGSTALATAQGTGLWRLNYYLMPQAVSGAATVTTTFSWTDDNGTAQSFTTASVNLGSSTSFANGSPVIRAKAGTAINYSTTVSGVIGAASYMLHLAIERLT